MKLEALTFLYIFSLAEINMNWTFCWMNTISQSSCMQYQQNCDYGQMLLYGTTVILILLNVCNVCNIRSVHKNILDIVMSYCTNTFKYFDIMIEIKKKDKN